MFIITPAKENNCQRLFRINEKQYYNTIITDSSRKMFLASRDKIHVENERESPWYWCDPRTQLVWWEKAGARVWSPIG